MTMSSLMDMRGTGGEDRGVHLPEDGDHGEVPDEDGYIGNGEQARLGGGIVGGPPLGGAGAVGEPQSGGEDGDHGTEGHGEQVALTLLGLGPCLGFIPLLSITISVEHWQLACVRVRWYLLFW